MRPYEDCWRHVFLSRSLAAISLPYGRLLVGCCRFDTLMRYNTVLIKHSSCCHDFFTHQLQEGVHYLVNETPLVVPSTCVVMPCGRFTSHNAGRQPSTL